MNTLRSDLLDDGERVLVLGDYSSHVPGSSGHVVAFWLEDVAGHVHQVDTWTETQHWVNKNFPTKTLNRVKSQTPTGCEELPCSRNHHHSAVWVSCDRIKAIHHLTADRRREQMWGWCSWYLRPSSDCECDQVRASRRLCSWHCVSQDGSAPHVWWTLPADWWPAKCTEIQDRLKTTWLWRRPEPAATTLDLRDETQNATGESSGTTADENQSQHAPHKNVTNKMKCVHFGSHKIIFHTSSQTENVPGEFYSSSCAKVDSRKGKKNLMFENLRCNFWGKNVFLREKCVSLKRLKFS